MYIYILFVSVIVLEFVLLLSPTVLLASILGARLLLKTQN